MLLVAIKVQANRGLKNDKKSSDEPIQGKRPPLVDTSQGRVARRGSTNLDTENHVLAKCHDDPPKLGRNSRMRTSPINRRVVIGVKGKSPVPR